MDVPSHNTGRPDEPAICLGGPAHLKTGPPWGYRRWNCTVPSKFIKGLDVRDQTHVIYEWSPGLHAYIAVETIGPRLEK